MSSIAHPLPHGARAAASPARHVMWLTSGLAMSFALPFVLTDQIGLQRDVYYGVYMAAVVWLFMAWARDTGQDMWAMLARHRRLAVGLGFAFAAISALIAIGAEDSTGHPGGIQFVAALL